MTEKPTQSIIDRINAFTGDAVRAIERALDQPGPRDSGGVERVPEKGPPEADETDDAVRDVGDLTDGELAACLRAPWTTAGPYREGETLTVWQVRAVRAAAAQPAADIDDAQGVTDDEIRVEGVTIGPGGPRFLVFNPTPMRSWSAPWGYGQSDLDRRAEIASLHAFIDFYDSTTPPPDPPAGADERDDE